MKKGGVRRLWGGEAAPVATAFLAALVSGGCLSPESPYLSTEPGDVLLFGAGFASQVALHELAHTAYAESEGVDYTTRRSGLSYRFRYKTGDPDKISRVGRMGYLFDTVAAEALPWVPGWRENHFLNGMYWGSMADRGKATLKDQGDVNLISDYGGPSREFLRGYFATSVAADLARWKWPDNPWIVSISAGLHGALLVRFAREF